MNAKLFKSVVSQTLAAAFLLFAPVPARSATPALDSEQWAFLAAINDFRAQNGVGPLQVSATLQNASQWMSEDLASKFYFSHTDSLGRDPGARMAAFGYMYFPWGENIAAGNSTAQNTFNQWANSPGHRANMLNGSFRAIGIGRAYNPSSPYRWYWTTDFGGVVDQVVTPEGGGGVVDRPVISSFLASPQSITAGQASTLSWNVSGATSLAIGSGVGNVTGMTAAAVYPSQTTTYTLTATNAAGSTTANVTVTVTAAPVVDSQPPSAPAIVSITAVSPTQVNLAWTPSSDNVGVAGYQVLRNGSPIASLPGGALSHSDTGVVGSTTYSYTVRAFDAASNYSAAGNTAFVTTPAPSVPTTSCPAAGSGVFTGCYYNNAALTGDPVYVRTDSQINFDWGAGSPHSSLPPSGYSVRWKGNLEFAGGDYTFTATASDGLRVYIDGTHLLDAWRDQTPTMYSFRQTLAQGIHLVTVEYYSRNGTASTHLSWQLNPPAGRREQASPAIAFFSGTPAAIAPGQAAILAWSVSGATSITLDNGIGDVTNVTMKSVSPSQTTTYTLTAANAAGSAGAAVTVVVNIPRGDSQPPTAPTLTSAAAKSAGQVDLSWTASTDDAGVTGYQILRNGSVLTSTPAATLSYSDMSVSGNTSYTYAIRAFDAAGNFSPQSNSQTVTTPAPPVQATCATPATGAFAACYYNNRTLSDAPTLIRTDSQINFDWTNGTPAPSLTPFNFSVRWQGYFDFQQGDYTFTALTSDGMRVFLDGTLVIDSWRDQPATVHTALHTLSTGSHLVTVEYYLRTGTGAAHLTWQPTRARR